MITLTLYKSGNELCMRKWKKEYWKWFQEGRWEEGEWVSLFWSWALKVFIASTSIQYKPEIRIYVLTCVCECVCMRVSECLLF